MGNPKKQRNKPKQPSISLSEVLDRLYAGEAKIIGQDAEKGSKKAQAVIAQYVWYLRHPKDLERQRLLCWCYERYRKSKVLEG